MGEGKIVARTYPAGNPIWIRDATANDSDKSFTVPANKRWRNISIRAQVVCTATVGTRLLLTSITDGTNVLSTSQRVDGAASQTIASMTTSMGPYHSTSTPKQVLGSGSQVNATATDFFPPIDLLAGYVIRVYDSAAIDAAADDLTVILSYEELDV